MGNSVHASNLKRPETPLDRTDPQLIAAMTASLRAGGPNTLAPVPVTTATVLGESQQRRDQRAGARTPQTAPTTPTLIPATPPPSALKPGQRVVLSAAPRRRKPRPAPIPPAPFRPGVFPRASD